MNLIAFLRQNKVDFMSIEKKSTHHASEASRATDIPIDQIIKTLVFVDDNEQALIAIVLADSMISRHKLEACSGSKSVHLASDQLAEKVTGYPTGGIPPVGHRKKLRIYIDKDVTTKEFIWCGGGARTRLIRLRMDDVMRVALPKVCDISQS